MADTTAGLQFDMSSAARDTRASLEDQALVQALRAGCAEAYEALIFRFQQPVYNLAFHLMAGSADVADVVQEVFLKVFRNIGQFRSCSSLKTWIYRITVNEAHNHRRWFCRHVRQEVGFAADDDAGVHPADVTDRGRNPFELACDVETRALVEMALADLKPNFRDAVVLRDMEDLSYEEIAAVLQVSIGTVKSRILRGREALRKSLEQRLEPEIPFWSPQTVDS